MRFGSIGRSVRRSDTYTVFHSLGMKKDKSRDCVQSPSRTGGVKALLFETLL